MTLVCLCCITTPHACLPFLPPLPCLHHTSLPTPIVHATRFFPCWCTLCASTYNNYTFLPPFMAMPCLPLVLCVRAQPFLALLPFLPLPLTPFPQFSSHTHSRFMVTETLPIAHAHCLPLLLYWVCVGMGFCLTACPMYVHIALLLPVFPWDYSSLGNRFFSAYGCPPHTPTLQALLLYSLPTPATKTCLCPLPLYSLLPLPYRYLPSATTHLPVLFSF